jgi:hypothetical protein
VASAEGSPSISVAAIGSVALEKDTKTRTGGYSISISVIG